MKEIDLFSAFTDVDDRFVLEVMEADDRAPKRAVACRAAVAAAAILLIVVAGIVASGLLKKETPTGKSSEPVKEKTIMTIRWADMPNYEKYSELEYDGNRYFGSPGTCNGAVGRHLGKYTVIGLDYGEKSVDSDANSSEKEEFPAGTWNTVENREVPTEVLREIKVDVYEIVDVDPSFAIAVKFPDEDRYCVYGNNLFEVQTYAEFADGTQLLKYTDLREITLNSESGTTVASGKYNTVQALLSDLFVSDTIPAFATWQLPTEFGGDAYKPGDTIQVDSNLGTAPNLGKTTVPIVSAEVTEFLQDKELGKMRVEIGVDYRLLGQQNVVITVYSSGFVTTNIGWTERTFYVGPECVESFIQKMK
jgi:hypothetical protein